MSRTVAAEAARDLDRLNLGAGTGGEDSADGLFVAALDFVQQTHGPSPFLAAAPTVPGSILRASTRPRTQQSERRTALPLPDTTGSVWEWP